MKYISLPAYIIKKFENLSVSTIYNIKYNRYIDYERYLFFNKTNKISNFNLNFVKKQKPIFTIENKSFQYNDYTFSIEKKDNILLEKQIDQKFEDKHNKTTNPFFRSESKKQNIEIKFSTYDKQNKTIDNNRTIKLVTQKREDSTISSINKSYNSSFVDLNIFDLTTDDKNKKKEKYNNKSMIIQPNLDILTSINVKKGQRDENEFLNSINKTSIINEKFTSPNNQKTDNLLTTYDERGYIYLTDGTFFDIDGTHFNEEGFDMNKGRHDRFGEYIPGPDFNNELGMYNNDIQNISFDDETLKKEIEDKEKNEFEKIKLEAKESKKLIKNYQLPIEKDDSCDSFNITEEFEKLDQSDSIINDIQQTNVIQEKIISENKNDTSTRFFNGEFNDEIEENIKIEEAKEKEKKFENKIEKVNFDNKDKQKEEENENDVKKSEKSKVRKRGKKRSGTNDNVSINNKNEIKKSKKKPRNNKRKKNIKNNNDNNNQELNKEKDKVEQENKKLNKVKISDIITKFPDITEESINKEKDFPDLKNFFILDKLFDKYGYTEEEKYELIEDIFKRKNHFIFCFTY